MTELQAEQTKTELELRREALEEKKNMAREEAEDAKDKAQEAYDKKSELWEQEHEDLIDLLEGKKTELDNALIETLQQYDDDLEAFKNMTAAELADIKEFVGKYNKALDGLEDKTITITTVHLDIYKTKKEGPRPPTPPSEELLPPWEPGEPSPPRPPTPPSEEIIEGRKDYIKHLKDITPGIQVGGIAMEEVIARVGEQAPRVPEAIIPLSRESLERLGLRGGKETADIHIYLDGRVIAEVIGEPLVDIIRMRTGVHI